MRNIYSSILYRCLRILILNEKKKDMYTHVQVANLEIYTRMHIYIYARMCVCVYIACIYAFRRGVREIVRRTRDFRIQVVALFSGNLTSLLTKKSSQVLIPNDRNLRAYALSRGRRREYIVRRRGRRDIEARSIS